jgi:hypothetical protein
MDRVEFAIVDANGFRFLSEQATKQLFKWGWIF